jgi:hypothetical protein
MYNVTTFELSEHDTLIVKPCDIGIQFSHHREGTPSYPLAVYNSGRWSYKDDKDRSLFLQLMQTYPKEFRRAFRKYFYYKSKDTFYTFTCAKRKFTIWSYKLNSSVWDKFYTAFYGR